MQFPASGLSICNDFSLLSKPRDLYTNYLAFPPLPLFSLPLQGSILIFGSSSETACFISKTQLLRNLSQFLIIENLNFSVSIHKTFNHTLSYIKSVLLNIVSYVRDFSTFVVNLPMFPTTLMASQLTRLMNIRSFLFLANQLL